MTTIELTQHLKAEAARLGFVLAGVCPAVAAPGSARWPAWLDAGYGGEMHYLADRAEAYRHPESVLEGVRSLLMLALPYRTAEPAEPGPTTGRVARYAWGIDYHDLIRARLQSLQAFVLEVAPHALVRGTVDTAPLCERDFAQLAGLGWIGKNTLLLNKQWGSWFFLAALLTDLELSYDAPQAVDHCGTCRACLDACPTDAFVAPYVLDARRCISYLTIELREAIPLELRPGMGEWLFGCEVCQEVCPWNRRAPESSEAELQPCESMNPIELTELFDLDEEAFLARFRSSPLWRAKRRGLLRNAAIVLGNRPAAAAIPALRRGLRDSEPLVREACAWALAQYPPALRGADSSPIGLETLDNGGKRPV
ncbi:MAG TPA: tRNA epoxyqueuosine(34) reductase QueG [Pirellulales bacterium]|nr:tRNA epoxyqueuosine(34) reductase QueG [Pirellulales bacterium]